MMTYTKTERPQSAGETDGELPSSREPVVSVHSGAAASRSASRSASRVIMGAPSRQGWALYGTNGSE